MNYGSDASGLVCGYQFPAGERGTQVDGAAALARESPSGVSAGFLWLHFDLTNVAADKWMRAHLDLPPEFLDSLNDGTASARIELADAALLGVLNDVLYEFEFEAAHVSTLWVCATDRMLVTARRKPLRSVDRLRSCVRRGDTFRSTVDMLGHLLRDQGDVLVAIVRKATARVDEIEDSLLAGRVEAKRAGLGAMRRVMVRLGRLLTPEPPALFRLLSRPPHWMVDQDVQDFRQATEDFAAVVRDMNVLVDRIKLLQEEVAAQVSEQNNRSLFVLTVLTVVALPINMIAGLFGMNVGGVPLAQHDNGFWIVVCVAAAVTILGVWGIVRSRRD